MVFDELMGNFIFYPGFPDFKGFVDFVERDGDPCFCVRMHYVMASCREMEGVPGMRRFRTKIEQKYRDWLELENAPPSGVWEEQRTLIEVTHLDLLFKRVFDMMYAREFVNPSLKVLCAAIDATVETGLKRNTLYKRMSEAHQLYLFLHPDLEPVLEREPWRFVRESSRRKG
ncbi:MAG TPA: hypothetical protein PKA78_01490 [Macellibacteroides fermentans]|uniref:hypothetical protein n=1 Tax=Macellibacteroides fermentans TaxID=879969 RepID=UPI002BC8C348|nr:hypothetical protein [Macellibacteroides fermentans]